MPHSHTAKAAIKHMLPDFFKNAAPRRLVAHVGLLGREACIQPQKDGRGSSLWQWTALCTLKWPKPPVTHPSRCVVEQYEVRFACFRVCSPWALDLEGPPRVKEFPVGMASILAKRATTQPWS
jgi:hypothetical protein